MELSKNALTVLERRYLIKNGEGVVIETVEELFRRGDCRVRPPV